MVDSALKGPKLWGVNATQCHSNAPWTNPGVRLRRVITGSARPLAGHDSLPNLLPLAIGLLVTKEGTDELEVRLLYDEAMMSYDPCSPDLSIPNSLPKLINGH